MSMQIMKATRYRMPIKLLKKLGAKPLVNPEIDLFVNKELFPIRYFIWPRMCLKAYADTPGTLNKGSYFAFTNELNCKGTDLLQKLLMN